MPDHHHPTRLAPGDPIYRYEVPVDGDWHALPAGQPLHVACRRPMIVEFWAQPAPTTVPLRESWSSAQATRRPHPSPSPTGAPRWPNPGLAPDRADVRPWLTRLTPEGGLMAARGAPIYRRPPWAGPKYATHASPEAIRMHLAEAIAKRDRAASEVAWLARLLGQREAQVTAGTWPLSGVEVAHGQA